MKINDAGFEKLRDETQKAERINVTSNSSDDICILSKRNSSVVDRLVF